MGSKTSSKAGTAASASVGASPGLAMGLLQAAHPSLASPMTAQHPPVESHRHTLEAAARPALAASSV